MNDAARSLVDADLLPFLLDFLGFDLEQESDLAGARQVSDAIERAWNDGALPEGVERLEFRVPGPEGKADVPLLAYRPENVPPGMPVLMFVHGGGMVMGSPRLVANRMAALAAQFGCAVVGPEYTKSPEGPWPVPVLDCYAALQFLASEAAVRLGVGSDRMVVFGESGGGGIAAGLALLARNKGNRAIIALALSAPMLDDRTGAVPPPAPQYGALVWTPRKNQVAWSLVRKGMVADPDCPIPARAETLSGLPPTYIHVGQLDLFFHEDLRWAERLADAGVPVELLVIPRAFHGFDQAPAGEAPRIARDALNAFFTRFLVAG